MYSEKETGGQRKELPLVRFYGFTNDSFCDLGKNKKLNNLLRVCLSLMQNIGCHKHAFTWY